MQEEMNASEVKALVAETSEETVAAQGDARVEDLERRIRELEAAIGDLRTVNASAPAGAAVPVAAGRKTQASYAPHLLAKGAEPVNEGSVDVALRSLSVEQRIAVKSGLLRAGLL
ncbi:hypothetical protein [Terriglobus sp.]|uniref:hypothetical protein n=1 Tax=Terriglobus sp. TaxID=1889013 RepID=UPI003B004CA4